MEKRKMTKAEAFEYLKGKKVRCYNIFDTDLSDKIFNKLKECGCYWRVDTNPKALIRYIDNSPYKAWALFVDDDGEISQLPISCAHFYKELGGVDIPFEDILSIEIVEGEDNITEKNAFLQARDIMRWLREKQSPHTLMIIDSNHVELLDGVRAEVWEE